MYIYVMEYYSGIKRNQLLIHTTTGVDFRGFMLNEKKASLSRSCTIQDHLDNILNGKITELGNRIVVVMGLGMVGECDYKRAA